MNRVSVVPVPANRVARRRERTRQEILAAAIRVLADKGFHDTKIADIAAAADVGVGTFYLHFPTKDALFDAVVDETATRLKATVDAARAGARDPVEQLHAANAAFCRFARDNREVFRVVFGHPAAYSEVIARAQALFAADIAENVREGVAIGVFAALPADVVAQAMVGMATQILSWWTEHGSVSMETLEETITTLMLRGLNPVGGKGADHA